MDVALLTVVVPAAQELKDNKSTVVVYPCSSLADRELESEKVGQCCIVFYRQAADGQGSVNGTIADISSTCDATHCWPIILVHLGPGDMLRFGSAVIIPTNLDSCQLSVGRTLWVSSGRQLKTPCSGSPCH